MNPEVRQTLRTITRNIEAANETAQENIYTFSEHFIDPCISSLKSCFISCTEPCFPGAEAQRRKRRSRGRSRGRAEVNFDFYDDWEDEFGVDGGASEGDALLGWGNDRLDRILAGSRADGRDKSGRSKQPARQRAMSYGSRGRRNILPQDDGADPTVIPGSSYLGFLERLPWKLGRRGLRYQPTAADLQEHPGAHWDAHTETRPLVEESDEDETSSQQQRETQTPGRKRSGTANSQSTTNSLSSRGDLIQSEDELEADAVPLDDEFAVVLERRATGLNADDRSSGKTGSGKRPAGSRGSTRTWSTKSERSGGARSIRSISKGNANEGIQEAEEVTVPSLEELKHEELQTRREEEAEIERRREAAMALAQGKGLLPDGKEDDIDPDSAPTFSSPPEMRQQPAEAASPVATDQSAEDETRDPTMPYNMPAEEPKKGSSGG